MAQTGSIEFVALPEHKVEIRVDFNDGRVGKLIATDEQIGEIRIAMDNVQYKRSDREEVSDLEVPE